MKCACLTLALTIFGLTAFAGGIPAPRDIPDLIQGPVATAQATWVAASLAVDAKGSFTDRVAPWVRAGLADFAEARKRAMVRGERATADCGGNFMSLPPVEHYRPHQTFTELTTEASDVVWGSVVATRQGLFRGDPAMMVRFEVHGWLRNSKKLGAVGNDLFLIYPYATLHANGTDYCTRAVGSRAVRFDFEPRVGDRLMVFSYVPGLGPDRAVIEADAAYEVVFERDGKVVLPPDLLPDAVFAAARNLDELLKSVALAPRQ